MKKFIFVSLFVLAVIFSVTPAFAMQCSAGNYGSDQCWTDAQVLVTGDSAVILPGTIMVYDFVTPTQHGLDPNDADRAAFYVRSARSTDTHLVAGVLQQSATSGDRVKLLVRGQGQLRVNSTSIVSGDKLIPQSWTSGTNNAGEANRVPYNVQTSRDKAIAFALESSATAATIDAYITVI